MSGLGTGSVHCARLRRVDSINVRKARLWAVYAFMGLFLLWLAAPSHAAEQCEQIWADFTLIDETTTAYSECAASMGALSSPAAATGTYCSGSIPGVCPDNGDYAGMTASQYVCYGYRWKPDTFDPENQYEYCLFDDNYSGGASCPAPKVLVDIGGGLQECQDPPPEPDCDEIDAPPGVYFCTRSAVSDAQNCVEGAVGPAQCMMETCPGAIQTTLNFQVGTNKNCLQNSDGSWSCAAELCPTGEYISDPGPDDQLDSDPPDDQELETTAREEADCSITGETNREVIEHGDYIEICTSTRTYTDGASCATDGESREVRECNITYQDGSEAQTRSEIDRDGETITGQSDSISARGAGVPAESVEEDDTSSIRYGACNVPPQCEGDVLQCAQVELQWLTMCADVEGTRGAADELTQAGDGYLEAITGEEVDITDSLSFYDAIGPLSGFRSCPAPLTMTLRGQVISFKLDNYCTYASYLAFLILGFASYKGGRIVLQGFAGA